MLGYIPRYRAALGTALAYGASSLYGRRFAGRGRSYTTTTRKRGKGKAVRSAVKSSILKMATTYNNTVALVKAGTVHNTSYLANLTQNIVIGSGNQDRQGDSVYLQNLIMNANILTDATSRGYQYRFILFWSGEEISTTALEASLIGSNQLFLPSTSSVYFLNGIINPKACVILMDKTLTVNSIVDGTSDVAQLQEKILINQKFDYQSAGSTFGKTKNLYLAVFPNVSGGTTGTTPTGTLNVSTAISFKNL